MMPNAAGDPFRKPVGLNTRFLSDGHAIGIAGPTSFGAQTKITIGEAITASGPSSLLPVRRIRLLRWC